MRKTLTAIVLGLSLTTGCFGYSGFDKVERYPVEQVFRDHSGYRIMYTDGKGLVHEEKFYSWQREELPELPASEAGKFQYYTEGEREEESVRVIKDLEEGARGYAEVVRYSVHGFSIDNGIKSTHVEIHLPKDQQISPGIDRTGGKYPQYPPLSEVK